MLSLQQAVNKKLLDNNDGGLTPIEDMNKLEDKLLPIKTLYIILLAFQILKQTYLIRTFIKDINELEDTVISTEIQPNVLASFDGK